MKSGKTKSDNRSKEPTRASGFLRLRWQQWLMARGGVKMSYFPEQPAADGITKPDLSTGKARTTAKNADSAASRNAQNCTFEVF